MGLLYFIPTLPVHALSCLQLSKDVTLYKRIYHTILKREQRFEIKILFAEDTYIHISKSSVSLQL